ncbi:MAG: DNA repair protein RecN [Firmicutes bacterium]|nr:DNA repair protein RecN [Bacillota bacterium]
MILRLRIENFALIEQLELELGPGLNVLTGETGAGKSIIIDAIALLVGGRASAEMIRAGSSRAVIESMVDPSGIPGMADFLAENGFQERAGGNETLVLAREIGQGGRNLCRIGGRLASAALLREAGSLLLDLHGQHEHQSLVRSNGQLELLDFFGGADLLMTRGLVAGLHGSLREAEARLQTLEGDERERARRSDMLRFQLEEIRGAKLVPGEEEALRQERILLAHAERLRGAAAEAVARLYEGGGQGDSGWPPVPALDVISALGAEFESLAELDPALQETASQLREMSYRIQELGRALAAYRDSVEADPHRLEQVEDRLALIRELKRKYGDSITEVQGFADRAEQELGGLAGSEAERAELSGRTVALRVELESACGELGVLRRRAGERLEALLGEDLEALGLPGSSLKVLVEPLDRPGPRGADRVEFLFAPNPGESPRPLSSIASGGELSRVMLALKRALAEIDRVPVLVFDEIDAGIGGRAAEAVAERLALVARRHQVLCVTHLPQIASFADVHLRVFKTEEAGRTGTGVRTLSDEERVDELSRMLGGVRTTEVTRRHAGEMLTMARGFKEKAGLT